MTSSSSTSSAVVLVVDDDVGLRRLVEKSLKRAGHEPVGASSAQEAVAWLEKNKAELMLLDLKLPDAVGADVIERLEEQETRPPFIVITGQGDERVAVEMMKRGASDYLVKDKEFLTVFPSVVDRVLAQRQIEKRLDAAEQQVRLIKAAVEEAQDAVLITTADNPLPKIVYGNPAFYQLMRLTPETAEGKTIDVIEPSATVCFRRALVTRHSVAGENRMPSPNETPYILDCHVAPIRDKNGHLTHWVSIQRDITERKAAEKALDARVRQQAAVAYLGNRVLAGIGLGDLLQEAAHLLVETLDAGFSKILEMLPGDEGFLLRAGAGWRAGYTGQARTSPTDSPAALAIARREPVIYEDVADDPRIKPPTFLSDHGIKSGISVPINDRDRPYGILGVDTREKRPFTGDDVHFLQGVANVISEALERRRSEKEILQASAKEQQRIGQDLHDGLGQHLAGIEILSHILEEELTDEGRPEAEQAGKIAARVREAITHTRHLARGLSPVHVEADGLMSALRELTFTIEEIFKVNCRFHCPEEILVQDNDTATHLYRIAQEATNNAIKHGKAKNISISLIQDNETRRLEIADDGFGFGGKSENTGIGLRIMNRRAVMIGGHFEILENPDGGATVICTIPNANR